MERRGITWNRVSMSPLGLIENLTSSLTGWAGKSSTASSRDSLPYGPPPSSVVHPGILLQEEKPAEPGVTAAVPEIESNSQELPSFSAVSQWITEVAKRHH